MASIVAQSLIHPTGLLEFEAALRNRFSQGGCKIVNDNVLIVRPVRQNLVGNVTFISHWNCELVLPTSQGNDGGGDGQKEGVQVTEVGVDGPKQPSILD